MSIRDIETGRPLVRMHAGETVLQDLDLADVLQSTDTISSVDSVTAARQGLVSGSVLPTVAVADAGGGTQAAKIRIVGGTAGEVYNVDVGITTVQGETRVIEVAVEVR